jgi:hypothetical protein
MKHDDSKEDYGSPKKEATPNFAGYPNNVASTQNMKVRGGKAQTKGKNFSGRTC